MTMSHYPHRSAVKEGDPLFPPASLGVIGSGQLGRMFIQAAQRMGYRAGVLSATEETPAAQVAHWTVIGPPDHLPALRAFADEAEAVTVEFENVSRIEVAGPAASRAPWLANALDQPEPPARKALPGPASHTARTLAAGSHRVRARRRRRRAGLALDPQDGCLGL
jgi:hypothetical protein